MPPPAPSHALHPASVVYAEEPSESPILDEEQSPDDRRATQRVFVELVKLHVSGANVDAPTELAGYTWPPKDKRNGADPDLFRCAAFSYRDPVTQEDLARLAALPRVVRAYVQLVAKGNKPISSGAVVVEVKSAARERADAVQSKVFEIIDASAAGLASGGAGGEPPGAKRKRRSVLGLFGLGGGE